MVRGSHLNSSADPALSPSRWVYPKATLSCSTSAAIAIRDLIGVRENRALRGPAPETTDSGDSGDSVMLCCRTRSLEWASTATSHSLEVRINHFSIFKEL